MNKWFLYKAFLLIVMFATVSGQTVEGFVLDEETGAPLPGANIFVKDTYVGCNADTAEWFEIEISRINEGTHMLQISYIGYHNLEYPFAILLKKKKSLILFLKEYLLQLDQIVVTGTRTERFLKNTPVTTQVINSEQLKNTGGTDISQALQEIIGIAINNNQFGTGVNTIELQGFSSEHILLMVDGVKMIGRVNGQLDIAKIPISHVERLETVKGTTSSLYGSEAMGGVINVITKQPSG